MVLGYNHNVSYKGEQFHVQTEDSGVKNPNIVTLLYRAGAILASKKTCYADILKIDSLETVVEDLMKEQHKDMMRRLKNGEFDNKLSEITTATTNLGVHSANQNIGEEVHTTSEQEANSPTIRESTRISLDDAIISFFR